MHQYKMGSMGSMPRNCPLNGRKSRFLPFLRAAYAFSAQRVRAQWVPCANALHRKPCAPPWRVPCSLACTKLAVEKCESAAAQLES